MHPQNFEKELVKLRNKLGQGYTGVLSESYLRAEVDLVDATGNYLFDFRFNKGVKSLTEILLSENDLFRVLGMRFLLGVRKASNPSIFVPQTYPNKIIFATETADSPAGTFDSDHLEAIYNGNASYKKGDTTYLKALPLRDSRFVSQTQQSSASNKSSTEIHAPAMLHLKQPFSMIGTDVGDLVLNIPAASALKLQYSTVANVTTAGLKIVAIIQLDGILATGGNKISAGAGSGAAQ